VAAKHSAGITRMIQNVSRFLTTPAGLLPAPSRFQGPPANLKTLSTGLGPLDKALGVKGLPYGRMIELIGPYVTPNSGGAISIATRIAARVQRQQQIVTIIDLTHSFDPWQAERCGLIAPQVLLTRPETLFETVTALEQAARKADLVIMVMGLVADLLAEVEPETLIVLLRRWQHIIRGSETVFLLVTAPAANDPFDPANYPPGFPLAELAAIRLWVQAESWTHKDGLVTAYKATLTVIKNELATPGPGAEIRIKLS
jgi:recombination protein RecA